MIYNNETVRTEIAREVMPYGGLLVPNNKTLEKDNVIKDEKVEG